MKIPVTALLAALVAGPLAPATDDYPLGPDSMRQAGVPQGRVEGPFLWKSPTVFRGTIRQYWVYVPAQYDAARPAAVMVFQDGHKYVNTEQEYRVPIVFDNLIHKREMPVTIGIFVNPGQRGETLPADPWRADNRSGEYDSLGEDYARLLIEEILPEVGKTYNLSPDPSMRAICGASSGGIAAFTAAWERPDQFRKVVSHIGSFRRETHGLTRRKLREPSEPTLFAARERRFSFCRGPSWCPRQKLATSRTSQRSRLRGRWRSAGLPPAGRPRSRPAGAGPSARARRAP
jgi:enterochelin esterase-like enzyme